MIPIVLSDAGPFSPTGEPCLYSNNLPDGQPTNSPPASHPHPYRNANPAGVGALSGCALSHDRGDFRQPHEWYALEKCEMWNDGLVEMLIVDG